MENYITYLHAIVRLRDSLIQKSGIKFVEGLKIWARYIITHISLFDASNRFTILPVDNEFDYQFIQEYMSNGCPSEQVYQLYGDLQNAKALLLELYPGLPDTTTDPLPIKIDHGPPGTPSLITLIYDGAEARHRYSLGKRLYGKLCRMYTRTNLGPIEAQDQYIWLILALYQILDGHSLQWAVPPAVMWVFKEKLYCNTDIFASPMNTYNNRYYSLFHFDTFFGSLGNFFTAPDDHFVSGSYHVNPPFIISLFTKTTDRILSLLERAEKNGQDLTFVYIMPDWNYFEAYNTVYMNRFGKKHIFIPPGQSYYHQYRTDTYILSSFGTHIFVLSTCYDICPIDLESDVCKNFKNPIPHSL
jgi:hypothetical protein